MSNIAGKSYAMNVITPINRWRALINLLIFWAAKTPLMSSRFDGLKTLSLIHYARWVILLPHQFPRLSEAQPKEKPKYAYMLFFSNFNGSWTQYVDSFHMAIPKGLDLLWYKNVLYPKSVPLQPFHRYITHNQIWTEHYYNAYPLAAANDVKNAMALRSSLLEFVDASATLPDADFAKAYKRFLFENQQYLGKMAPSPVVSLANQATRERRRLNQLYGRLDDKPQG
jgi:hypothetical protein